MSALANVIELPVRHEFEGRDSLEHDLVLALATADDLASGLDAVVGRIRRDSGATRAEWWANDEDGALEPVAVDGIARGGCHSVPLGPAGVFVLHGGRLDWQVESALNSLAPIIRRRAAEERLARTTVQLAHRNEALEDFAALVAHELKTPLQAALVADDPSRSVDAAILLVDALLEASRSGASEEKVASVAECLEQAVEDLRVEIEITVDVTTTLPLPPAALRVILRNLLANAVAAGAGHVEVTAARTSFSWRLFVDDDGVGLADVDRYKAGSGLGLSLSRRIAGRFGGALELAVRPSGGTRATLTFDEALA
jgi:signal transduction histidine kinase